MSKNREDVKLEFEAAGVSIREWAPNRGYNPRTVYAVLNGSLEGKRGVSHKIAVDLGLKSKCPTSIPGLKAA